MNWYPKDIKEEKKGNDNYLNPSKIEIDTQTGIGSVKIRIMSEPVFGYKGWKDGKPFVRDWGDEIDDSEVDLDQFGNRNKYRFIAFVLWNYDAKRIQIMEARQEGIKKGLKKLSFNPDWGDVRGYDVRITKDTNGERNEYTIDQSPPKEEPSEDIVASYVASKVDLDAMLDNTDPFAKS